MVRRDGRKAQNLYHEEQVGVENHGDGKTYYRSFNGDG